MSQPRTPITQHTLCLGEPPGAAPGCCGAAGTHRMENITTEPTMGDSPAIRKGMV